VKWKQHVDSMTGNINSVACEHTSQEIIVQPWQKFQWYGCHRIAQNHSTSISQNFRLLIQCLSNRMFKCLAGE
jgi:hypothetical protein